MLDPKLLRAELPKVAAELARRGFVLDVEAIAGLEERRKAAQMEADGMRAERNANAKATGQAKAQGRDAGAADRARRVARRPSSRRSREELEPMQAELSSVQLGLPNILHASVPPGRDEADNVEVRRWGEPRTLAFEPQGSRGDRRAPRHGFRGRRAHLGRPLRGDDRAARQAASRAHPVHARPARRASTAIGRPTCRTWCMPQALHGTGQLPKFEQDLFAVSGDPGFFLIPTAEVPVTNLVRDQILEAAALPMKYRGSHAVLPLRGGRRRQGHARHDPPASVREGRAGADRAARGLLRARSRS